MESLLITAQSDAADLTILTPNGPFKLPYSRDYAIGAAYTFTPNVVGKLEFHDADGYEVEAPVNFFDPPIQSQYLIASVSVAF